MNFDLTLYLVTDRRLCGALGVLETVRQAVAGGVTLVQLRDPEAATRDLMEQARALKILLDPLGVPLIINDRVDVAAAVGAAGVHLGQDDMRAEDARNILGDRAIIGLSIGTPDEFAVSEADLAFVDYVGIGPVRGTSSKAGAGEAIGVEGFAVVRRLMPAMPVVAIGGLRHGDAPSLVAAGASGVAVISAICGQSDPHEASRLLRHSMHQ